MKTEKTVAIAGPVKPNTLINKKLSVIFIINVMRVYVKMILDFPKARSICPKNVIFTNNLNK